MAHILFLTPYYPPEVGAPQTRISETATRLVQRGHDVTVLTTLPNYPTGIVPSEYRHGRKRHEIRDGVRVIRVWSYISPNKGFLRRILSQLSFGLASAFLGARHVGHPDIIIVESPPLFDAISGRLLAHWKRCPFIFTVADIWPEAAVQLGLLRNRLAIRMAESLERSTYLRASAVWTMTEGFRQTLVQRGLPPEHIFVVPNGVDTNLFHLQPKEEARTLLGWDDRFTILFTGTIGLAQGLTMLIDAAEHLREYLDIHIVLVGDGATKEELKADAQRRHLQNISFLDALPHSQLPLTIAAADVCFSSLRKVPLFEGTMPVKLYEYMACGRPILLAADGQAQAVVSEEAGAAIHVPPGDASALADAIVALRDQPALAKMLGQSGRIFVEAHYDRDKLTTMLEARILQLLEPDGHSHPTSTMPLSQNTVR